MQGETRGSSAKGKVPEKRGFLSRRERIQLMAATGCDERTIRRWERGEKVWDVTKGRLEAAAKKLDIPLPEQAA
jgi:transcriptional regulator with XRE-family HTH domain